MASAASSGPSVMATTSTSSLLGQLQGLLHRVLVQLGQQPVGGGPIDGAVGGESALTSASGTCLTRTTIFMRSSPCRGQTYITHQ